VSLGAGRDRRVSSNSSSSSSSEAENQQQKQKQQQQTAKQKIIENEESARRLRIGQMEQRLRKAVSREDRISVLETELAKQQAQEHTQNDPSTSLLSSSSLSSSSSSVDDDDEAVSITIMTNAERAELNSLLQVRDNFEEQYDPLTFKKKHLEFKDMHNDVFIQLIRYCEREREQINNNTSSDSSTDSTTTTATTTTQQTIYRQ